ncbi:MAG: DUF4199 domain-containing protein, partial [Bacteroidetes bacterium]|nr:DUF4199 domain-containing protein [Bacteroidota bacterium]
VCLLASSIVFNLVLFNLIDPGLIDTVVDIKLEKAVENHHLAVNQLSVEAHSLEEGLAWTEWIIRKSYSLSGAIVVLFYNSVFWGLLALIVAAIFKRSPENKINF